MEYTVSSGALVDHPVQEKLPSGVRGNCYWFVETQVGKLPSMDWLQSHATTTIGKVAIFMYPPSEGFPNGTPHVAVVESVGTSTILIRESHFGGDKISTRTISKTDKRLVGFYSLP